MVYKVERQSDGKRFALKRMIISGVHATNGLGWHFLKALQSEVQTLVSLYILPN